MRVRTLVVAGAAAAGLAALAGAVVWAQAPAGTAMGVHRLFAHADGFGPLAFHHALRELDLTPEQKTELRTILRSHRQEFRDALDQLAKVHEDAGKAGLQEPLDEAGIRAKVSKALQPLGDLAVLHAKVHREIAAILTPEQREKAEALHEKLRSHLKEMHESLSELGDDLLGDHS
jgi:periplasmic protein CpxP/Spy